jgi:hypothetical protein
MEVGIGDMGAITPGKEGTADGAVGKLDCILYRAAYHTATPGVSTAAFSHIAGGSGAITGYLAFTVIANAFYLYMFIPFRDSFVTFKHSH